MSDFDAIDTRIDIEHAIRSAIRNPISQRVMALAVGGYRDTDISAALNIPVKSVGEIRRRARAKIRVRMRGYYGQ